MTTSIDHDIERDLTGESGHGHGCWEIFSEKAVEAGQVATGRHDDEIDGVTLFVAWLDAIEGGLCERQQGCPGTEYDGPDEVYRDE